MVEGPAENLLRSHETLGLVIEAEHKLELEEIKVELRRQRKAPIAVGTMALVLVLATLVGFHISTAMVIGSLLMVLLGVLTMDEAYESIEWRSVFLIAGMLPLVLAIEAAGTARFLADLLVLRLHPRGRAPERGALRGDYGLPAAAVAVVQVVGARSAHDLRPSP
jgi:di/tricarboxylate transporter